MIEVKYNQITDLNDV